MSGPGVLFRPDEIPKTQAKADLQELSMRLGNYIQFVRETSQGASHVDLASFVDTIKILEDELVNFKNLYEMELQQARRESEDNGRYKNQFHQEATKAKTQVAELENRLAAETDRNRQATDEINIANRTIMEKDREITELKLALQKPIQDLDLMTKEFDSVLREKETVKRRHDHEQLKHQEMADKVHQLGQKISFDEEIRIKEATDLNDRLQGASNTILSLEAKIRDMTHADAALAEMLERVRDVAESEIERYRQESEARFAQNVFELQSQLNDCNRKMEDLSERNNNLHHEIGDHLTTIRALEGEVSSLNHQKRCMEEMVAGERMQAHENIKALEFKLTQLQDLLVDKMKQINAARDAQVPLKAEIETLRTMLSEEERRLRMPASPRTELPPVTKMAFGSPDAPAGTSLFVPGLGNPSQGIAPYSGQSATTGMLVHPPPQIARDTSPRPLGPVRVRSAPASRSQGNLVPTSMGTGKDYFDDMFNDLKLKETSNRYETNRYETSGYGTGPSMFTANQERSTSVSSKQGASSSSNCATGNLKILEIHPDGKFVRLINNATSKDEEFGGYMLQQNVGGNPVAVYRFAPRVRFPANSTITVWSGVNDPSVHKPPTDFFFKEQQKWGTGAECTTILCKPNGQAIAWTTAAHRISKDLYTDGSSASSPPPQTGQEGAMGEELMEYNMNVNAPSKEPVYLRREKDTPPCLSAPKHPHGHSPPMSVHPQTGQGRPMTYGNDNSSVNRQSRVQSSRPDPIPGAPYAGAAGQRMGSASLRRYTTPTTKGSGAIANKSAGTIRYGPPTPHLSMLQQDYARHHNMHASSVTQCATTCT